MLDKNRSLRVAKEAAGWAFVVAVALSAGRSLLEIMAPTSEPWGHLPTAWTAGRLGESVAGRSSAATGPILIFSDYRCPACNRLFADLKSMSARTIAREVLVHTVPPPGDSAGFAAAVGAICAGRQSRFAEAHTILMTRGSVEAGLEGIIWEQIADTLNLDTEAYLACLSGPEADSLVRLDAQMFQDLGLDATPTIVADGLIYRGQPRHFRRLLGD